eukprot:417092-Rhodomonas_salina.1
MELQRRPLRVLTKAPRWREPASVWEPRRDGSEARLPCHCQGRHSSNLRPGREWSAPPHARDHASRVLSPPAAAGV